MLFLNVNLNSRIRQPNKPHFSCFSSCEVYIQCFVLGFDNKWPFCLVSGTAFVLSFCHYCKILLTGFVYVWSKYSVLQL